MNTSSFTAGADDRVDAAITTRFSGRSADTLIGVIASDGTMVLEADEEDASIGSASHTGDTIVVIVDLDPKCDAPEWDVIGEIGVFTGSFIIKL